MVAISITKTDEHSKIEFPAGIYPIIGIVIAICGNIMINIALNLQRYAHKRLQRRHVDHQNYLKSQLWWAGTVIMTVGETGNFLAYGFAPASIVSPLGVFSLVSNCIIAPVFFGETIYGRNIAGVAVAICGILLLIMSVQSEGGMPKFDNPYRMVLSIINQMSSKIYLLVTCTTIATLAGISNSHQRRSTTKMLSSLFINIALVALFGAFTALATKCLSSLLSFAFLESFLHPVTYILMVIIAATAVCQILYLNRALQHFDATLVIPMHFVFFTISVITASGIVFHDFEGRDAEHLTLFFTGCILTFIGVWLIAASKPTPASSSESALEQDISEPLISSSPARPILSRSLTSGTNIHQPRQSREPGTLDEMEPLVDNTTGNHSFGPSSTSPTHYSRIVSSMPLTSSGFFVGPVLDSKRSLQTLNSTSNNITSNEHGPDPRVNKPDSDV